MGEESGLVSVLIPTYYRNERLRRAIESVRAQAYEPVEIIVVDDSGEAHAEHVVSAFEEVSYVPLPENRGLEHARNVGIEAASGEFVQLLDDDDRLLPGKFTRQMERFTDGVGVVYGGVRWVPSGKVLLPEHRGDVLPAALELMQTANTCSMLIRAECLAKVAPLDYGECDVSAIVIELARRTRFEYVHEPLVEVYDSPGSKSEYPHPVRLRRELLDRYADLYERYPEARRAVLFDVHRAHAVAGLERRPWSARTVVSNAMMAYYATSTGTRLKRLGLSLAALLGRPGVRLADRLWNLASGWK